MKDNPKASQKELAEMLGISQSWISQLLRKHADS
ncbi:sigma factor-like helix-turn-helix DNA-binding protein [Paenibacillus ehimensis]|nr:sigma factor-like helix-turn-helix DNA-binding protein [Paenibacillus ehimensis]